MKRPGIPKPPSETGWALLFILPCLLGLIVFTYLPTFSSFGLSFQYWNLLGAPKFVGLENYRAIFGDPLFWKTLQNTFFFVVLASVSEVCTALLLAVWLNRLPMLKNFFRTVYFLPYITPVVSVALVWTWLFDSQHGAVNDALLWLRLIPHPVAWLYTPETAMAVILLLRIWKNLGYNLIIILAGLQAVPDSVYESAELDGASPVQVFFRVTLPMISPTLFFVSTISFINAFQAFDSVYLLTQGGPAHSTELLVYWMFKNAFEFYKIGPASALAVVIFSIILVITLCQWQLRKRWVLHED